MTVSEQVNSGQPEGTKLRVLDKIGIAGLAKKHSSKDFTKLADCFFFF